jgi:8-oxo-dGTP diphosphatase
MKTEPKIGIGVAVIKGNTVLLGKRLGSHGAGEWSYPGGHLENYETWEECATRELKEEVGINVTNLRFGFVTNDIFETEGKHYVTICMIADYESGEVIVLEPKKCEEWKWYSWENLPKPLFLPIQNQLLSGFNPFAF